MTDMYLIDSGKILPGLSIALPSVREEWRPTLQRTVMSNRESRVMVVRPFLPATEPSQPIESTTAAVMAVLAVILVVTIEVGSEVTLVIPSAPATAEEGRETRLPASLVRGPHGSPSR